MKSLAVSQAEVAQTVQELWAPQFRPVAVSELKLLRIHPVLNSMKAQLVQLQQLSALESDSLASQPILLARSRNLLPAHLLR
jgi:hypothetical protein